METIELKKIIRNGPYAWPGGYPIYFIAADGAALSYEAVRENWPIICRAHRSRETRSEWYISAWDINWEDIDLYCEHTGKRIQSAYAD